MQRNMGSNNKDDHKGIDQAVLAAAKDVLVDPGWLDQAADSDLEGSVLYARLSEFRRLLRTETEIAAQSSAEMD
jgi:hypothetical protein